MSKLQRHCYFSIYVQLDTWSVKPTFSLTVKFYLARTENRTKKSHTIALNKETIFGKNC